DHDRRARYVREAAERSGRAIAVLADLQGPKIRLGTFGAGPVELVEGATFTITTEEVEGTAERASTTHAGLPGYLTAGDEFLIDDRHARFRATAVRELEVVTKVEVGGVVSDHKGINLPGVQVSVPAMSDKDVADLRWALHARVD